jgi:hypothetical protein
MIPLPPNRLRQMHESRSMRALFVVVVIICALSTCAFLYDHWKRVRLPFELDYGEGIVLWQAELITHPATAYASIHTFPSVVFHYTPVYQVTVQAVSRFAGLNLLFTGRFISWLASLGLGITSCALLWIALPVNLEGAARGAVAATGLCIYSLPAMLAWVPLARVDMLGVLFTFLGILFFVAKPNVTPLVYGSFLFFIAAVYTKQTLISAPLACVLVLMFTYWRLAAKVLAFALVISGTILAILTFWTNGEFVRHVFVYNVVNTVDIGLGVAITKEDMSVMILPRMLAAAPILSALFRSRLDREHRFIANLTLVLRENKLARLVAVLSVQAIISYLLAALAIFKSGSNINYFLETNIAVCILCSVFLSYLIKEVASVRGSSVSAVLACTVALLWLVNLPVRVLHYMFSPAVRLSEHRSAEDYRCVMDWLSRIPGPVVSEDMTVLIQSGRPVLIEPKIFSELQAVGLWNEDGFVNQIRNGTFDAFLLEGPARFTPGMMNALKRSYFLADDCGLSKVYFPSRSRGGFPSPTEPRVPPEYIPN